MNTPDPHRVFWLSRLVAILALSAAAAPAALVYWTEAEGALVIPMVIGAVPLYATTQRRFHSLSFAAALLMLTWVFLSGFTVGFLFVPSLVLMLNASLIARNPQPWTRGLKLSGYGFIGGVVLSLGYAALELLNRDVALDRPTDFFRNWQVVLLSGFAGAGVVFLTTFGPGRQRS